MLKLIALASKGILRDMQTRRRFMFWVMLAAMVMLFFGSMSLSDRWAREHPWLYLGYWFICGWLALTGMMLALFDLLLIRAAHRAARRKIAKEILEEQIKHERRE